MPRGDKTGGKVRKGKGRGEGFRKIVRRASGLREGGGAAQNVQGQVGNGDVSGISKLGGGIQENENREPVRGDPWK